jgi:membrane protease subunit HflK
MSQRELGSNRVNDRLGSSASIPRPPRLVRLAEAAAYKQQRIAKAVGETSQFLALQKEYEKVPDITRTRLYLEAMERILPKVQLYVIDSDKGRVPLHLRVTGK